MDKTTGTVLTLALLLLLATVTMQWLAISEADAMAQCEKRYSTDRCKELLYN